MRHLLTLLTLLFFSHSLPLVAAKVNTLSGFVDNPKSSTCSSITFSYTVTGARIAALSNQNVPSSSTVFIVSGGNMVVSQLVTNTPTTNLRFVEALNSNGNVIFAGSYIPVNRASQDYSVSYFGHTYGPYTLVDPAISGTLSETFTPYVDLNNNQQYDAASECLGDPVILNYEVRPTATVSYTATGTTAAFLSNQTGFGSATVTICAGGWMAVSSLAANVPTSNLRFIEATTSNGNVAFGGYPVPVNRESQDYSVAYFNQVYGMYTLLNPAITGTLSETFTPYIDINGNQFYDATSEFLGNPFVLNYVVITTAAQATIQPGMWSMQAIWSCGRTPTSLDQVLLRHTVTVSPTHFSQAKKVSYQAGGRLRFLPVGAMKLYVLP